MLLLLSESSETSLCSERISRNRVRFESGYQHLKQYIYIQNIYLCVCVNCEYRIVAGNSVYLCIILKFTHQEYLCNFKNTRYFHWLISIYHYVPVVSIAVTYEHNLQLIVDGSPHMASWKSIINGSGNGLSYIRHKAITWTGLMSIEIPETDLKEIWNKIQTFSFKNAIENVACKMLATLFLPQMKWQFNYTFSLCFQENYKSLIMMYWFDRKTQTIVQDISFIWI